VRDGLDRNVGTVLEVFADSALAAAGLIDADRLRTALLAPRIDNSVVFAVENLLGCETWLRTTTAAVAAGGPLSPNPRRTGHLPPR
jgi:asparagine synthase (glutamine-hydrolysing)